MTITKDTYWEWDVGSYERLKKIRAIAAKHGLLHYVKTCDDRIADLQAKWPNHSLEGK